MEFREEKRQYIANPDVSAMVKIFLSEEALYMQITLHKSFIAHCVKKKFPHSLSYAY